MERAYVRINWENQPSTATALGATNLNKIDLALEVLDGRVVALHSTKADLSQVQGMVQDVAFNPGNGVFTITKPDGTVKEYDTKLEKLAVNFAYEAARERLAITLDDGTVQYVDMSSLITEYEFADSGTVAFRVQGGKVSAEVKDGSITEEKFRPDFLADCRAEVANAQAEAARAAGQAQLAKRYAVGGVIPEDAKDNAKYYSGLAQGYAEEVQGYAKINCPRMHIDLATGHLVSEGGAGLSFHIDGSGHLISEVA